uniref:Uncharacterized protein n=1 Tax=Anguilla anguilla TaxID=7936 RepID=A0A0E9PN87_ANGAN
MSKLGKGRVSLRFPRIRRCSCKVTARSSTHFSRRLFCAGNIVLSYHLANFA